MTFPTLTVGSITVIPLSDGALNWAPSEVWPSVSAEQWQPVREYLNPDGTHHFNLGSFLIREDETWTLVDTGFGNRPGTDGANWPASWRRLTSVRTRSPASSSRTCTTITSAVALSTWTGGRFQPSRTRGTSFSARSGISFSSQR
jgi:hypothetical protein